MSKSEEWDTDFIPVAPPVKTWANWIRGLFFRRPPEPNITFFTSDSYKLGPLKITPTTTTMSKPDLKPCPFCGGKANYYSRVDYVAGMRWISIICTGCEVEKDGDYWGVGADEPANANETAAYAWNKRAEP